MHVSGKLPGTFEPFETRMRLEFHDEADSRTRLEIREWLPEHLVSPTENGWGEAFTKLDAVLAALSVVALAAIAEVHVEADL